MNVDSFLHRYLESADVKLKEVETLLKGGLNVNLHNNQGYTPLHCAVRNSYSNPFELLFRKEARTYAHKCIGGCCCDLYAATRNLNVSYAVIELLLKHKANVNAINPQDGYSVLHYAVSNTNIGHKVIELLLEYGADVLARNTRDGYSTALMYAVRNPNLDLKIIKLLLEKGSDIHAFNTNDRFNNVLLYALKNPGVTEKVIELLLKYKAKVNDIHYYLVGITPLQCAFSNSNITPGVIEVLLKYGAYVCTQRYLWCSPREAFNRDSNDGNLVEEHLMDFVLPMGNTNFDAIKVILQKEKDHFKALRSSLKYYHLSTNGRLACLEILKSIVLEQVRKNSKCIKDYNNCQSVLGNTYFQLISSHRFKNDLVNFVKNCVLEIMRMKINQVSALLFPCMEVNEQPFKETAIVAQRILNIWSDNSYPIYFDVIESTVTPKDIMNALGKFRMYSRTVVDGKEKVVFLDFASTMLIVEHLNLKDMLRLLQAYCDLPENPSVTEDFPRKNPLWACCQ